MPGGKNPRFQTMFTSAEFGNKYKLYLYYIICDKNVPQIAKFIKIFFNKF